MSKLFKVTDLSESGYEIKHLLIEDELLYDFPYVVKSIDHIKSGSDGLPIVGKLGKPSTLSHAVALGHFIYEELNETDV